MIRKVSAIACAMLCALAISVPALAQEEGYGSGEMPPMGAPEQMKEVAFMQGDWNIEFSFRMTPESDFVTTAATASVTSALDGCIQRMDWKGDMMGMTMLGEETLTFNRETGKYQSTWVDSMSGAAMHSAGTMEGDKMVMKGTGYHMGNPYLFKTIGVKVSDDELTWEMKMSHDEGETWYTGLKAKYTRAQT